MTLPVERLTLRSTTSQRGTSAAQSWAPIALLIIAGACGAHARTAKPVETQAVAPEPDISKWPKARVAAAGQPRAEEQYSAPPPLPPPPPPPPTEAPVANVDAAPPAAQEAVPTYGPQVAVAPVVDAESEADEGLEWNTNRYGFDIREDAYGARSPQACRDACDGERACASFSYVRPEHGSRSKCWLKGDVPRAGSDPCCVSGVKRRAAAQRVVVAPAVGAHLFIAAGAEHVHARQEYGNGSALEWNTNRDGSDYRGFELVRAEPEMCRAACEAESRCSAFSYVKPGIQGRRAHCWLKSGVPSPSANNCCVSGVRTARVSAGRERRERR